MLGSFRIENPLKLSSSLLLSLIAITALVEDGSYVTKGDPLIAEYEVRKGAVNDDPAKCIIPMGVPSSTFIFPPYTI